METSEKPLIFPIDQNNNFIIVHFHPRQLSLQWTILENNVFVHLVGIFFLDGASIFFPPKLWFFRFHCLFVLCDYISSTTFQSCLCELFRLSYTNFCIVQKYWKIKVRTSWAIVYKRSIFL